MWDHRPVFPYVTNLSSKGLDKHETFMWRLYRDSDMTARVCEMREQRATLGTLFLNKVALLTQCRALTKVLRQCICEGRLNSPLILLPFENPSRPRLTNTNAAFHFDYLILTSLKNNKSARQNEWCKPRSTKSNWWMCNYHDINWY